MTSFVWLGLGNLALAAPLAIAAWLAGRFLRRPAITHGLWVLVLLKLVTPPLGLVPVATVDVPPVAVAPAQEWSPPAPTRSRSRETSVETIPPVDVATRLTVKPIDVAPSPDEAFEFVVPAQAAAPLVAAPLEVIPPLPHSWWTIVAAWSLPAVAILWIFGAVVYWLRTARAAYRFERLLSQAPLASAEIRERVERLANELNVRVPSVRVAEGVLSPMLWVWGRTATLVLPRVLFERLSADQQTMLLVHELAHWKRGDHWVRRLECLAGGLYWWCPLTWWARAELRQAEEECCDAWVMSTSPDSARSYALTLAMTVDFLSELRPELPPLASGLGSFPSLQRRLTMIFRTGIRGRLSLAGALGLAALGGLLLTWSPGPGARAQDNPRPKKDQPREQPREGPRDGDPKPKPKPDQPRPDQPRPDQPRPDQPRPDQRPDVEPGRGPDFKKIREDLEARRGELNRLQQELAEKSRQLQMMMDRLREAEQRGGPPGKKDVGREGPPREGPPREGPPREGPPPAREDVERRVDDLERKLDVLIKELVDLRRGMGKGFGPGAPPNGFGPPKRKDGEALPPPRREGDAPPPPRREGDAGPREGAPREGAPRPDRPRD